MVVRKTREAGEEEAPKMSARDKLKAKAGKKVEAPSASKKKDRPIINVEGPVATAVDQLLACSNVKKVFAGHEKAARALVMPYGRRETLLRWLRNGSKTENCELQTPSGASFILQVKDTLTGARGFRVPKGEDKEPIQVETHLRNNGVPDALIERLMEEKEFKDETVMTIPMAKLEKEHPSLADRLINLILAANEGGVTTKEGKKIKFSDEEVALLVESQNDVTIQEGFLQRVVGHVKAVFSDEEEQLVALDLILAAVPPQWAVDPVNPGLNQESVIRQLLHEKPGEAKTTSDNGAAPKPPEPPKPVDHAAGDKYTLRVLGLKITVVRKSDKKELATKTCQDSGHVANTVKKWQRDPAALSAFIAENV